MIKIWQFLWHGCWHDWKLFGKGPMTYNGKPAGQYYVFQCSKCNRIEERGESI